MARRRKIQHFGGSCVLGGNTPCASTASTAALNSPTAAITVEAWVKPFASTVTDYAVIAAKVPDGSWADGGWVLYFTGRGELKFYVNHYVTGGVSSGPGKLLMNVWQHVVGVYDGAFLRLYINGVQVGTPVAYVTPITQTAGYVGIGATYGAQPHSSPCSLVRIYARALTATEVADRYYERRDNAAMRVGLVGDWDFANIAGTSCPDGSGNGASMTLWSASIASTNSPCKRRVSGVRTASASGRGMARNLVLQSGHLDVSPWAAPIGATPSAYVGALPAGVDSMVTLTDLGAGAHFANQAPTVPFYTDVIVSGYARKMVGAGWVAASIDGGASVAYFDINTGALGTVSAGLTYAQIVETDVAGVYRWSFKQKTTNDVRLRAYIANGNMAASYTANGNAVAMGGFQVEVAAPGQLTPQLPISTLAAPATGRRDTRQNALYQSERVDLAPWTNARVSFATGADGGIDVTDSGDVGSHYVSQAFTALASGLPNCTLIAEVKPISGTATWFVMSTDAAATNVAYFNLTGAGATGTVIGCTAEIVRLASGAYRCTIRGAVPSSRVATLWMSPANASVSYGNGGFPSVLRVYRTQLAQTNASPDYVKTKGGIWVPNGAPRLAVI